MKYRFSSCELDTDRHELSVGGVPRPVEPQVFALLQYLIANREQVVSKDDIIDTVWKGRIVSDEALSSRISTARKAVGDDGHAQTVIRTVARRGFRFVADVEVLEASRDEADVGVEVVGSGTLVREVDKPAIAVLPFDNMSNDPEQEYFSDGLTEDIISALALWRMFPVIARNSSFVYKGRAVDVKTVGRELGARYVLEGSVRRSDKRLRITAQLIDATTSHHVWTEKFDRDLVDVFTLQDEISQRIAAVLEPTLGKAEIDRSSAKLPDNLDAWDFYLRGRARLHEFTKEGNAGAREMFERAIELDPKYSRAYADLAWSHSRDLLLEFSEDRRESKDRLFEAARRAVQLDDASSRARIFLATAYLWRNEHDMAVNEARRAVDLNPSDADARHQLGNILDLIGDPKGAAMMARAMDLDLQNPQRHMQFTFLARALLNERNYDEAADHARRAVRHHPGYPHAHYILAMALGHLGCRDAARAAFEECERLHPGFTEKRAYWKPYLTPAENDHLRDGLRKAGLTG
jgi:adenylate cyclase